MIIPSPSVDTSKLLSWRNESERIVASCPARENHIIRTIAPFLRKQGIFLAGADFIDSYLTELNITSPSAIRQINAVSGEQVQHRIVNMMLEKTAQKPCCAGWRDIAA